MLCSSTVFWKKSFYKASTNQKHSPTTKEGFTEFSEAQFFLTYSFTQLYHWLYEVKVLITYQLDNWFTLELIWLVSVWRGNWLNGINETQLSNVWQLGNTDPQIFGSSCTALLMYLSVFLKRVIFFFVEEGPHHSPCHPYRFPWQLQNLSLFG